MSFIYNIYAAVHFRFLGNSRFWRQKRPRAISWKCNLVLAIILLKPIARGTRTECRSANDTGENFASVFGASTKGAAGLREPSGGWRAGAQPAEGESTSRRRREVKGHVTGDRERRGWGWEEVEVSWFLRCRTEVLSVPQELSRDTDVRERLSSLPRVTGSVESRDNPSSVHRSLCALRLEARRFPRSLFCSLCPFLAAVSGKLSKYRCDILRLRSLKVEPRLLRAWNMRDVSELPRFFSLAFRINVLSR